MSYADQRAFYDMVLKQCPNQQHFDLQAWMHLFNHLDYVRHLETIDVLEVGGWKGELAATILNNGYHVTDWTNYEIAEGLAAVTVCRDPRYHLVIPDDFVWNIELHPGTVGVLSHVIEHLKWRDLEKLLVNLPFTVRYLGIEAPIQESLKKPLEWVNYPGTHILEYGWDRVMALLQELGFEIIPALAVRNFRAFRR